MTWIKLNDNAVDHPKIAGLSDRAFRWWVRGLSYASAYLTDGVLPPIFFRKVPKKIRAELTNCGLWDFSDPNLLIHDYLGHQSSKDTVDRKKQANKERQDRFRNALRKKREDALVTTPENREQRTENREQKEQIPRDERVDELFESWWSAYPKKTGKGAAIRAWKKLRPSLHTCALMHDALKWQRNQPQWSKDDGAYVPNPATYLNQRRWEDEPFFAEPLTVVKPWSASDAITRALEAEKKAGAR